MIVGDRFELLGLAGVGTSASVFRVHDHVNGDTAAVKMLHAAVVNATDIIARFQVEGDLLLQFKHPHILSARARGIEDRQPWLATDFAPGGSLADRVLAGAGISPDVLFGYIIDTLSALTYIHNSAVIHRDVKPENILISTDGRALLADFGIASSPLRDRTSKGLQLGTPSFCPPEQLLDATPATPQTDIYAVGVTLFTCMTKQSGIALLVDALRPRALAMLPVAVAEIVDRATALDPTMRYGTADQMSLALQAVRVDRPSRARSPP